MKLARFVISGSAGAAINLGLLFILADLAHIYYLVSAGVAFAVSQVFSFLMQKFWAFRDGTTNRIHRQAIYYVSLGMINIGVNIFIVFVLVDMFELHHILSQAVASIIIAVYSYIIYSHIFRGEGRLRDTISPVAGENSQNKGFTLIELLVVIAIIGILASVILVSINTARNKGSNARILAQTSQIKTQLEQNYVNSSYADLDGTPVSHAATLVSGASGEQGITLLACNIGSLLSYPSTVADNLVLTCDGVAGLNTGVVIYANQTGSVVLDYGIYATTTPGGYVCFDSFGHSVIDAQGSIPAYTSITSTSTALCQ